MATLPLTAGELAALKEDNEALLPDTCEIYQEHPGELRPGGETTQTKEIIYTGPCSLKVITARRDRYDTFAEGLVFQVQYRLIIPASATGIRITHKVRMLTCDDTDALTRIFEVRDVHRTSQISQRRLTLHDIGR